MEYETKAGLEIQTPLAEFVENELLKGAGIAAEQFWQGLARLNTTFGPKIAEALKTREEMQGKIDAWFAERGNRFDQGEYKEFLREIGYLVAEGPDFKIETQNVDPEISSLAGPQLVVPLTNARYLLNAANARWGSLYDAFYGTDAMGDAPEGTGYDTARGLRVIHAVRDHLDRALPLVSGSWRALTGIDVVDGALKLTTANGELRLKNKGQFAGFQRHQAVPLQVLFYANGLMIEIRVDPDDRVAKQDPAGIADVRVEAALSSIMDAEDSVAAVDGEDKALVYRNWLGLMRGTLTEEVTKNGETFTRKLNPDSEFKSPDGDSFSVKGRALMLVRNVGHLMTTPAVRDENGHEISEGLLDALVTVAAGAQGKTAAGKLANSEYGSIYVVKPKMHGPEEVALSVEIFDHVEELLGLRKNTVKIGIMDEERRTSANLRECIRAAKERVFFINTGFLDRTGDEIHTHMEAGGVLPKTEMKSTAWIGAYEARNVEIGLACGFRGVAQIGKGMWAQPNNMKGLLEEKIGHPKSGASTAWVPSPTAATLHALHYHQVSVESIQADIMSAGAVDRLDDLLTPPLLDGRNLSEAEVKSELDNNLQGILGYVVRWVDSGVGCSTVPDIHDVGLMEDRATCRISSQMVANWLKHGLVDKDQVEDALARMAAIVDKQNQGVAGYKPLADNMQGHAMNAARELVYDGASAPSGYTEPALHKARLALKSAG